MINKKPNDDEMYFNKELILSCKDRLSEREMQAIMLRFGHLDDTYHTYKSIGQLIIAAKNWHEGKTSITPERVRQIILKAQRRIRRHLHTLQD